MHFTDKEQIKQFIEENDIKDIASLNEFLNSNSSTVIEQILQSEGYEHLGYKKIHRTPHRRANNRDGHSKHRVLSVHVELEPSVPQNRGVSLTPQN